MADSDPRWPDPEEVSRGGADRLRDEQLTLLAAEWLARGFDSSELVRLAAMTPTEARAEARRLLPGVVESLGLRWAAPDRWADPDPVARFSSAVAWAVGAMGQLFTPYSAAQKVLEEVEDEPSLHERTAPLSALVRAHDASPPHARSVARQRLADELVRLHAATRDAGPSGADG